VVKAPVPLTSHVQLSTALNYPFPDSPMIPAAAGIFLAKNGWQGLNILLVSQHDIFPGESVVTVIPYRQANLTLISLLLIILSTSNIQVNTPKGFDSGNKKSASS
jgi:hypothetical protein